MHEATLIVTVYNQEPQLKLLLQTFLKQTNKNVELFIADDGSSDGVGTLIENFKTRHPEITIKHIWHEDKGFRKTLIQNEAMRQSSTDYFIFVDGDMLLDKYFIENHLLFRDKKKVLMGYRGVLLLEEYTKSLLAGELPLPGGFLSALVLRVRGALKAPARVLRLKNPLLRALFVPARKGLSGGNFSLYKSAMQEVNGFNEDIVWYGYEDYELGHRLKLAGYELINVSKLCNTYHMYHKTQKRDVKDKLGEINRSTVVFCENGLARKQEIK